MQPHIAKLAESGPGITYGASASAVLFWGLHVSDIAVIMSAFASICGVALQFYLALYRIKRLESGAAASAVVTTAMAQAQRVTADKVDDLGQKVN